MAAGRKPLKTTVPTIVEVEPQPGCSNSSDAFAARADGNLWPAEVSWGYAEVVSATEMMSKM